ncbi:MAG: hypothetical protein ACTTKZ_07670 [Bacteroides sp.]
MSKSQDFNSSSNGGSTEPRRKNIVVSVLFFIILFLLILAGVLGYFLRSAHVEAERQTEEYIHEKDSILVELQHQVVAFDSLKSTSEDVQTRLRIEKQRAEELVEKIRAQQQVTFQQLKSYQRELGTLREIMRNMVHEIDSLNTANKQLMDENSRMRGSYAESQQQVRQLTSTNEELSTAVMRGSVVKARNIIITALNKNDNETKSAKRTRKIRTSFILMENALAKPGPREVYIRITDKEGVLLVASDAATFKFGGQDMPCSAHREIDYQNEDLEATIYYNAAHFSAGEYHVSIFMDDTLIGESSFILKKTFF